VIHLAAPALYPFWDASSNTICSACWKTRASELAHSILLEIDRHGFFEADTNISAHEWPIYPKFSNLVFCFIIKRCILCRAFFTKSSKIRIYELKFLKL